MKPLYRIMFVLLVAGLGIWPLNAQTEDGPLVVFIEDPTIQTSSINDDGLEGLSNLANLFQSLGAQVATATITEPLPSNAAAVVLVNPNQPVPATGLARLLAYLDSGGNLLLALDPRGHRGANTDSEGGAFARLLSVDYGIILRDGFLVLPLASNESIRPLESSYMLADPVSSAHPVSAPLLRYQLPVQVWGTRHLNVEAFGPYTQAHALLTATPLYAETDQAVFRTVGPEPLRFDMDSDYQGEMILGAVGENQRNNSRIAVFGDSEAFLNGFGLEGGSEAPRHLGNTLLAQNLAAWLMETPVEDWPALPQGFTWVAVDGSADDWTGNASQTSDDAGDSSSPQLDLTSVEMFQNDGFAYILLQTEASPLDDAAVEITATNTTTGEDLFLLAQAGTVVVTTDAMETEQVVPDAATAIADVIEIRLPLRLVGTSMSVQELCLLGNPTRQEPSRDCINDLDPIAQLETRDPSLLRTEAPIIATVVSPAAAVNLRSGPSTQTATVGTLVNSEKLVADARSETGDWLRVWNAAQSGWVASSLVITNGDTLSLPVAE